MYVEGNVFFCNAVLLLVARRCLPCPSVFFKMNVWYETICSKQMSATKYGTAVLLKYITAQIK